MTRVLYVEDEPFLAKIVKETLEKLDFDIIHIDNGNDAINCFDESQVDICILDIMLPGKSGFQIAEEIRMKNKHIPIIFLTAKNQTEDVVKGFKLGANDYLRKPFSMEELVVRIDNALRKSQGVTSYGNKIGIHFEFEKNKQLLTHPKGDIHLSFKESQILDMLISNKNETISRKDILIKVWGDDSYFNSRNLDVYIRKLRKYFSVESDVQIITLKGVGYRFTDS